MQSLKPLRSKRSLAAAIIGIGLSAPVFAISVTPNQPGTADEGMVCRNGYSGSISGSAFKCTKTRSVKLNLVCANARFPNYLIRAQGAPGTTVGQDLCLRNGVSLGSTDPLGNLVQDRDFVVATVDSAAVDAEVADQDRQEASALGLDAAKEVDTVAAQPVIKYNEAGSRDKVEVRLTHYTFAIKTGGIVSAQR